MDLRARPPGPRGARIRVGRKAPLDGGLRGGGTGRVPDAFGIRLDAESRLWVPDSRNARYTLLDTDGELLATHPRPIRSWGFVWTAGFEGDRLFEFTIRPIDGSPSEPVFVRLDERLEPADTFPALPPEDEDETYVLELPGGRVDHDRVPERKPAFTSFFKDDRGYLWVRNLGPAAGGNVARRLRP